LKYWKSGACLSWSFVHDTFSLTFFGSSLRFAVALLSGAAVRGGAAIRRDHLERGQVDRNIFFADAQEAADADDHPDDLAGLVEQQIIDVADMRIVRTKDVGAFELRKHPLIRTLHGEMNFPASVVLAAGVDGAAIGGVAAGGLVACAIALVTISPLTATVSMSLFSISTSSIGQKQAPTLH
jgi:hypothetical protein